MKKLNEIAGTVNAPTGTSGSGFGKAPNDKTMSGDKALTVSNGYSEWDAQVAWRTLQHMKHQVKISVFHGGTSAEDAYMCNMENLRAFYRTFYNHEIEIPPYDPPKPKDGLLKRLFDFLKL
jgi:hypothetical protein